MWVASLKFMDLNYSKKVIYIIYNYNCIAKMEINDFNGLPIVVALSLSLDWDVWYIILDLI